METSINTNSKANIPSASVEMTAVGIPITDPSTPPIRWNGRSMQRMPSPEITQGNSGELQLDVCDQEGITDPNRQRKLLLGCGIICVLFIVIVCVASISKKSS